MLCRSSDEKQGRKKPEVVEDEMIEEDGVRYDEEQEEKDQVAT